MKTQSKIPDIIKISAVVTAMPRWVVALLLAEGFPLPESWHAWWIPASALFGAAMAVVEGLAFTYVFNQWKQQRDKMLGVLAILSGLVFVVVLTPVIAASVVQRPLADVLSGGWLYLWSGNVALSTIIIVASVGYAQSVQETDSALDAEISAVLATSRTKSDAVRGLLELRASLNGNGAELTDQRIMALADCSKRTFDNVRSEAQ